MSTHSRLFLTVLILGFAIPVLPALAADEVQDVVKDAVDPYNPGSERSRFLAAAGVDSELSEEEFKANSEASNPFVRPFDKWSTLKAFDKNANGKVDWFEADGYRRAVRKAVLGTFDKNDNTRLQGEERDAANKSLASGKLPKIDLPSRGSSESDRPSARPSNNTPNSTPGNNSPRGNDDNRRRGPTDEERAAFLKKYDEDGNGELSREERDKGFRAERERRMAEWKERDPEAYAKYMKEREERDARRKEFIEKYDKDGDGDISREEGLAAWKDRDPDGYARYEQRRKEAIEKFDKDGDGQLNDTERRAAYEDMRNQFRAQYEELTKKYDGDGDGRLSREEREAAIKKIEAAGEEVPRALRWDPRGRGGDRGRGGPDRGGDRGRGGPDRDGDRNRGDRDNDA